MELFQQARTNMVTNQLMTHKVNDPQVLEAMECVPRHQFVEGKWQDVAYVDREMPLGDGRVLLKPEVFAYMVQAAQLKKTDRVLDVACGTGYSTAVLAQLCDEVIGVESVVSLCTKAKNLLSHFKVNNAFIFNDNLFAGNAKNAPYNVILVNGALEQPHRNLLDQLCNGGRLITPIVTQDNLCRVVMYEKVGNNLSSLQISDGYASKITN